MRSIFTVHAGEYIVGQYIEKKYKNTRVWIPGKDTGIDLLVTDLECKKSVSLQVKFSKDHLPDMRDAASIRKSLESCAWFTLPRKQIETSPADLWVLVLLGFEKKAYNYLVVEPEILLSRLDAAHGARPTHQVYVWVTKERKREGVKQRAWLTRDIGKEEKQQIADDNYKNRVRDVRALLNRWERIERL